MRLDYLVLMHVQCENDCGLVGLVLNVHEHL